MEPEEWIERFAVEIGLDPPGDLEVEQLLDLAGIAAHSSARTAAPIACWLAGRSDLPAAELIERAKKVAN